MEGTLIMTNGTDCLPQCCFSLPPMQLMRLILIEPFKEGIGRVEVAWSKVIGPPYLAPPPPSCCPPSIRPHHHVELSAEMP